MGKSKPEECSTTAVWNYTYCPACDLASMSPRCRNCGSPGITVQVERRFWTPLRVILALLVLALVVGGMLYAFSMLAQCCMVCAAIVLVLVVLAAVFGMVKRYREDPEEQWAREMGKKKAGKGPADWGGEVVDTDGTVFVKCPNCGRSVPEDLPRCNHCKKKME